MALCYKSLLVLFTIAIAISSVAAKHIRKTSQQSSDILPAGYIGGGKPVGVGRFPWIVRLEIKKPGYLYLCGGSLISDRHVLSAAHCFEGLKNYSDVTVYLGEYNSDTYPKDCVEGNCTENVKVHPNKIYRREFNNVTFDDDIVVLRLEKRILLSDTIQVIALPTFDPEDKCVGWFGPSVIVAGWGIDEHRNISSSVLLSTDINLINRALCLFTDSMPEGHFCAGNRYGKSTCAGDSGGPLMMFYDSKYYVAGIISYTKSQTCPAVVGYFTNVYKYKEFIEKALENSSDLKVLL